MTSCTRKVLKLECQRDSFIYPFFVLENFSNIINGKLELEFNFNFNYIYITQALRTAAFEAR